MSRSVGFNTQLILNTHTLYPFRLKIKSLILLNSLGPRHRMKGTCKHVIYEADYMAAVMKVEVRQPVKPETFGVLAFKFSEQDGVERSKSQFLLHQERNCAVGMADATTQFHGLLRGSSYHKEVIEEVRRLTEEMEKTPKKPELRRSTSALETTRLDFAAQAIFQAPVPEEGEASTDGDAIEAMLSSVSRGGYQLMWFEALARARGESNEEGVGPFIISLLDLRTSDPLTWVAFKRQEFRWTFDNFARQGLAMSVNLFAGDFLADGIVDALLELHDENADAFELLHVELLESDEDIGSPIITAILKVHRKTGLKLARDDVGPEELSDPVKRERLIQLYKSLDGCLTVMKLDSNLVCGAMNVPLVPRCFDRTKQDFDTEVVAARRYREAWAAGMNEGERKYPFPLELIDASHFTQKRSVRTYATSRHAMEHAAAVVEGFVEVSSKLAFNVELVAEVSVYANDFKRQLDHPIFEPFVKALLMYAKRGKLFIQGSMGGARAVSDAVVPHLVEDRLRDTSGDMKELIHQRQTSKYGGADKTYDISEDRSVYAKTFGDVVNRMRLICTMLSRI